MAKPEANFNHKAQPGGHIIDFINLSTNGPTSYSWVFGDGNTSTDENPTHDYTKNGFFNVTLIATNADGASDPITFPVGVNAAGPVLSQSVYTLVKQYIPENITYSPAELKGLIEKWQLYLHTLVDHVIAPEDVFNEFAYTPLENTLVAQLAAYDIIIQGASAFISSVSNGGVSTQRAVKKITTGPTEVQWFPATEAGNAMKDVFRPGGAFEEIKQSICMIAKRIKVSLPIICPKVNVVVSPLIGKVKSCGCNNCKGHA